MSTADERPPAFERHFHRALLRLRGRSALRATATLLPWLQVTWLALFLGERFGFLDLGVSETASVLLIVLAAVVLWRALGSPTGRDAALLLDRRLGTRELVTTAYETAATDPHPLAGVVRDRASGVLSGPAVAEALPWTSWRRFRPALLGLAAVLLAGLLPPLERKASASVTEPDPAVEATAAKLAEELAPLAEEMAGLEQPEAREALERLQQLVDEMRSGELATVEDALVALNKTEQALAALSEEMSPASLAELVEDMAGEPLSADLARAMTEGDRDALRESLRRISEAMSREVARSSVMERQIGRLADRFEELAEILEQQGEGALAEKLRELAEALRSGNLERARELLESEGVARACTLGGSQAKDDVGAAMAELLGLGRYLLGQKPPKLAGDGNPARGRKSGPGPGQGSTHQESEGYATGDPRLRDRRSTRSSDKTGEFEALYDSRFARGEGFEDIHTLGQVGEEGEMLSETGRGLGVDGGVSLPLEPFASGVPGAPERAMDLESVPQGYRGLVRSYFSRTEKKEGKQ